ncbi:MAG: hypothetical protein WC722_00010 [Rhodospirillales bacterium]|jgi:hypothetical protein
MAKPFNLLKSEEISLSLNIQTVWYLDRLVEKGLYGNSRAEAAKIVLFDHCKLMIAQGQLSTAPELPSKEIGKTNQQIES